LEQLVPLVQQDLLVRLALPVRLDHKVLLDLQAQMVQMGLRAPKASKVSKVQWGQLVLRVQLVPVAPMV
jgi:hypothetical protein